MNIELIVPENTTMNYTLMPDVQEFVCHIGAHAHLVLLYAPDDAVLSARQTYVLQKESHFEMRSWYEHAIKMDLEILLQGASAQASIKIGFKGDASDTAHINTVQRHEAPHTTSSLLCKSLLSGHTRTLHTGMIYVAPEAIDTDARLYSNHMLTSSHAYAYVQPNLEVLTNDVRCAHGSAIGMFDDEMLFYMQARGLDTDSASVLLEEAFFAEVR